MPKKKCKALSGLMQKVLSDKIIVCEGATEVGIK